MLLVFCETYKATSSIEGMGSSVQPNSNRSSFALLTDGVGFKPMLPSEGRLPQPKRPYWPHVPMQGP